MTLDSLVQNVAQSFKARFERDPLWVVAAPGRVNLIGEHTDYNDGFVLPMAIERYTVIAAAPARDGTITWMDRGLQEEFQVQAGSPILKGAPKWSNYVRGVLAGFQQTDMSFPGFDAVMGSSVPMGGGLSSSAALEVASATLVETITGRTLDPVDKALLCQKAEHEYAGVPCGIMDQFISVLGRKDHLLLIDCRSRKPELVPLRDASLGVLIFNTNVKHELSGGEYAERRAHCEEAARALGIPALRDASEALLEEAKPKLNPTVYRRARHVIGENLRTTQAATAIRAGDWMKVGELMYASHDSLRDDYEVSCTELDEVVELARELGTGGGVLGCRMTGGGFGGCAVALVRTSAVETITRKLVRGYKQSVGIDPAVFVSRPAAGATVIKG
ncbi:MAG: galactokinase [Verrucomicrobia bacterium]|nr:galactokinase [Verrucomicrobiota bacterium]